MCEAEKVFISLTWVGWKGFEFWQREGILSDISDLKWQF